MGMIPSLAQLLPKIFVDAGQDETLALISEFDSQFGEIEDFINGLNLLFEPDLCPAKFLRTLGNMLSANISDSEPEASRRRKIYSAIKYHKIRGSWNLHVKPLIDGITGYNSQIYSTPDSDDWILYGGDSTVDDDTKSWGCFGCSNGVDPLGFMLVGAGTEVEIQGNIYIDMHQGVYGQTLTAAQITEIRSQIEYEIVPAYMIVNLCYFTALGGSLTIYPNGTIQ